MVTAISHAVISRIELLAPAMLLAFFVGEWLAQRVQLPALLGRGRGLIARLGHKLDRANRGVATLVYRGLVAVIALLILAGAAGFFADHSGLKTPLIAFVILLLWFGHCFATISAVRLWRRARDAQPPLELAGVDYLFADGHAVLRYSVATRAEAFAVGIIGASFWYVLGGLGLMFCYLAMAAAAHHYRSAAFGWAARSMFALLDALPRFIARVMAILAALFTPGASVRAVFVGGGWRRFNAALFTIALGGPCPDGDLPWVGDGTARLGHKHLRCAIVLYAVAALIWLLILALLLYYMNYLHSGQFKFKVS